MTLDEACMIYARSWNRLDPELLIDALDLDIRYSSQQVLTDMNGKDEVAGYLRGKMNTIRSNAAYKIFAQLARTQPYPAYPNPPEPCVVLSQGKKENLVATVLLGVLNSKIVCIDMCIIPPPQTTKRTNDFPN